MSSWRKPYAGASELLFFAENIFGHQYALFRDEVVIFDPEQGKVEHFAFKLERWAQRLLEERESLGEPQLKAWLEAGNPELGATQKLQPSVPACLDTTDPVTYKARDDLDLMLRYARLFKAASVADDVHALDLDWWFADDAPPPK